MLDNQFKEIEFPNGKRYRFVPESSTIREYGIDFPSEFLDRNLLVTGFMCTGKSTLVAKARGYDSALESKESFSVIGDFTKDQEIWYDNPVVKELLEGKHKVAETHLLFYIGYRHNGTEIPVFVHHHPIYERNYSELELDLTYLSITKSIKEKILLEFRLFEPNELIRLMRKRHDKEKTAPIEERHTYYPNLTPEHIKKGEYLLIQTADYFYQKGLDVYLRDSFSCVPLRFVDN
ncbi:MAG: hypothetical protein QF362_04400 [Candidatus Woesearchaeota archaeon]|jgi:hypothetical protein|nr:hypothetical protein [Candidatus Woesearchaeota archaeon]MDP7506654.1 hypothetical protein [Candidatus Woesearchaeota archaeon]|tara:strand:- start:1384 stop:2085 length:702 start_codon:yes stop_codon:yes gene_type:complete